MAVIFNCFSLQSHEETISWYSHAIHAYIVNNNDDIISMIKQDKHISCVCVSKGEYELINIFRSISLYVYNILKQYLALSLIIVISDIIIIYLNILSSEIEVYCFVQKNFLKNLLLILWKFDLYISYLLFISNFIYITNSTFFSLILECFCIFQFWLEDCERFGNCYSIIWIFVFK